MSNVNVCVCHNSSCLTHGTCKSTRTTQLRAPSSFHPTNTHKGKEGDRPRERERESEGEAKQKRHKERGGREGRSDPHHSVRWWERRRYETEE